MGENEAFFEMIKEWTVNDYYTQSIKSEVIIDTLISGFIEEMVAARFNNVKIGDVKLLAKEFPIRINDNNKQNAKVDYLVKVGNTIYLVELKTTNKSLDDAQKERMKTLKHKVEIRDEKWDLGKFFIDVIECQKNKSAAQKKYFFTRNYMKEKLQVNSDEEIKAILKELKVDIMYICLRRDDESEKFFNNEKIEHFYLEDFLEKIENETTEETAERERFNSWLEEQGRENNWNKKKAWNKLKIILKEVVDVAKNFED